MAINRDFIGRTFESTARYQVGREKLREFAQAIGDFNPIYHDVQAAQEAGHPDIVAPPTFAFSITYKALIGAIGDPALGIDYGRVVHGEQHFHYERPLYAGDEVSVTSTVEDILTAGKNELLVLRQDVYSAAGELIASTRNITVSRGTAPDAAGGKD